MRLLKPFIFFISLLFASFAFATIQPEGRLLDIFRGVTLSECTHGCAATRVSRYYPNHIFYFDEDHHGVAWQVWGPTAPPKVEDSRRYKVEIDERGRFQSFLLHPK